MDEVMTEKLDEKSELEERQKKVDNATNRVIEELEIQVKQGYKEFVYKDQIFKIYLPKTKEDTELARYKSKLSAELLKNKDLMLKDEVINLLKERGIWDDAKEKKENELRERLTKNMADTFVEKNKEEPDQEILKELRQEKISVNLDLMLLSQTKDYFYASTVETQIEEQMTKMKLCLCIKNENDQRVWNSLDELENYNDKAFINLITMEAIYFWAGLDQALFDSASN